MTRAGKAGNRLNPRLTKKLSGRHVSMDAQIATAFLMTNVYSSVTVLTLSTKMFMSVVPVSCFGGDMTRAGKAGNRLNPRRNKKLSGRHVSMDAQIATAFSVTNVESSVTVLTASTKMFMSVVPVSSFGGDVTRAGKTRNRRRHRQHIS